MKFSLFPLGLVVKDIQDFTIKNKNIVSFKRISLEIPFTSVFSKNKEVDISIHNPKILLEEDILDVLQELTKKKTKKGKSSLTINRISIKKGELVFKHSQVFIKLLDFDLEQSFKDKKTVYKLTSPHLRVIVPPLLNKHEKKQLASDPEKLAPGLEGDLVCRIKQTPDGWRMTDFAWNTNYLKITMNGKILKDKRFTLNLFSHHFSRSPLLLYAAKGVRIRTFFNGIAKIAKDKQGVISINGQFNSRAFSFFLGKQHPEEKTGDWPLSSFSNLRGNVRWNNENNKEKYEVNLFFADERNVSRATLRRENKITAVNLENISAEKAGVILNIEDIAQIGGKITSADLTIKNRRIKGKALLGRYDVLDPQRFNLSGWLSFDYNTKTKTAKVDSVKMDTDFGRAVLAVESYPKEKEKEKLKVKVSADITGTGGLDRYTDFYIGLDLSPWRFTKGKGKLNLDVKKIKKNYFVKSDFELRDFYSGGQFIASMTGRVSTEAGNTDGKIYINDKDFSGAMKIKVDKDSTHIKFQNIKGESQKILKILDYDIDLTGWARGDFSFERRDGDAYPLVQGSFYGKKLIFYGFDFENVSGNLENRDYISVKNLKYSYKGGRGEAGVFIDFNSKKYDIKGEIKDIDLRRMHKEFAGRGDILFSGAGGFAKESLTANDPIDVTYHSDNVSFYKDRPFRVKGEAKIYTDFSDFTIQPGEKRGEITAKTVPSSFEIQLSHIDGKYSGSYTFDLQDINLLIPWGNNRGQVEIKGELFNNAEGGIDTGGRAIFKGEYLSFPKFPHALENFEGDLIFNGLNFNLRNLRGSIGGGSVESKGYLIIEEDKLKDLLLEFSGENMELYPMDRTACRLNAKDLTLKYIEKENKLLLSGALNFPTSLWEREVDEDISFSTTESLSPSGNTFLEMLKFDLKLIAKKDFQVDNSLLNSRGKFDLRLTGSTKFPLITGAIDLREGYLEMSDNRFELVKGKINFNKNDESKIDLEAETFIKNYHIKFLIKGSFSRLVPQFQSSPPLPPRDILTLLSLGELFERPTGTELSSQVGAGTTGLIAQEIAEQIKKRTEKIFGDYVLRINPNITNITGASFEDSSRVIVGKSIARDILIVYSTNFSTQRQEVLYVQYQLSPSISLVGMRNEEGRFSIEVRFRKRR